MRKKMCVLGSVIILLSCYTVISMILMELNLFPRGGWNFVSLGTGIIAFFLFIYLLRLRRKK